MASKPTHLDCKTLEIGHEAANIRPVIPFKSTNAVVNIRRSAIMEGKQTPVTIDIPASLQLVAFFFNLFISLTISHSKPNHHLQHWALLPNDIPHHHKLSIMHTLFGVAAYLAHLSNKERVSQV